MGYRTEMGCSITPFTSAANFATDQVVDNIYYHYHCETKLNNHPLRRVASRHSRRDMDGASTSVCPQ